MNVNCVCGWHFSVWKDMEHSPTWNTNQCCQSKWSPTHYYTQKDTQQCCSSFSSVKYQYIFSYAVRKLLIGQAIIRRHLFLRAPDYNYMRSCWSAWFFLHLCRDWNFYKEMIVQTLISNADTWLHDRKHLWTNLPETALMIMELWPLLYRTPVSGVTSQKTTSNKATI